MLLASGLSKRFGGVKAVSEVSFCVAEREVVGLIGPNGAGKTTTFNLISGLLVPDAGSIMFDGKSLDREPPHRRAACGISRTFQHVQLMPNYSVLENVMLGCHLAGRSGVLGGIFRTTLQQQEEAEARERARAALELCDVASLAGATASSLAYGVQRRVELARAIVMKPRLLLLDEPAAGLNDAETEDLGRLILSLRAGGATVLLVEHAMPLVMSICDRVIVLDFGSKLAEGPPQHIQNDPRVIEAYLGRDEEGDIDA